MFPHSSRTGFSLSSLNSVSTAQIKTSQAEARPTLQLMPMPPKIEVEKFDASRFRVRVIEAGSESTHQVTLNPKDRARLAGEAVEPETLIRKSFEFLLERESKESILSRFDLSIISRYFPEFESEIKKRLL
jgi:hypothetical protein